MLPTATARPEHGQGRADRPPRQVLQDERERSTSAHSPVRVRGSPTRASRLRCRCTASVKPAVLSTIARCFAAGMISAVQSRKVLF